jgi:hypothetical protein
MPRELKKPKFSKEKSLNTKKPPQLSLKPEESLLITSKVPHSYKREKSVPPLKSVLRELL